MGSLSSRVFAGTISTNLAKPRNSPGGYFVMNAMKKRNAVFEKNAVELIKIQPHFNVLEVGFGPGVGLKHAYNYVKDGQGKVYGVDISKKSVKDASSLLQSEINEGKIILHLGTVTDMPFDKNSMDRIFHTNCYYFWPDMDDAVTELHRVIKPDGVMVTAMNFERLKETSAKGWNIYANTDEARYMNSLKANGFVDVKLEDHTDKKSGFKFQVISATAQKE